MTEAQEQLDNLHLANDPDILALQRRRQIETRPLFTKEQ